MKELFILLSKLNFTAEVDALLLGTVNEKVFYRNRVEFANVLDKVMINIWGEVEQYV